MIQQKMTMLEWMSTVGLVEPLCKKLQAKDGRKFSTAAFRVSCSERSKDLFYNEDSWPLGCELRDWIFYDRKPVSVANGFNAVV
jgi:hypothetical protein